MTWTPDEIVLHRAINRHDASELRARVDQMASPDRQTSRARFVRILLRRPRADQNRLPACQPGSLPLRPA
jgi:hypothetical protein